MQMAPKHIKYYIKRLEEYGFKLKCINEALIGDENVYLPFIFLEDNKGHEVCIVNQDECYSMSGARHGFELHMPHKIIQNWKNAITVSNDCFVFEAKDNNWREAFNKLVASFSGEIMKNTNHHTNAS